MAFVIAISPHGHNNKSTNHVMRWTLAALLPGIIAEYYLFGWGVVLQLIIAMVAALLSEALILRLRHRPVWSALRDTSAVLTAVLLAVAIPPLLPGWMTLLATIFAIVIAKQLYGGLGQNIFNPAMVGYVFLLISFPVAMTSWLSPLTISAHRLSLQQTAEIIWQGTTRASDAEAGLTALAVTELADGTTMATPLDHIKTELHRGASLHQVLADPRAKIISHDGWRWINLAFLAGGLLLWMLRIIPWQTPAGMLIVLAGCSALAHYVSPGGYVLPELELLSGATMLGAFFIVTDPVTSSTTPRGRFVFGALVGLLVFLIRHFGGYPDGVAFAVLLCNILVPMIDRWTPARVYGH